jgi:hypothetical protein
MPKYLLMGNTETNKKVKLVKQNKKYTPFAMPAAVILMWRPQSRSTFTPGGNGVDLRIFTL